NDSMVLSVRARVETAPLLAPPSWRLALPALLRPVTAILTNYFSDATHPFNLAIVRILVFVACLSQMNLEQILWFSKLPRVLLFPPNSLTFLVPYLPINPEL